ncbi:hypothetical protein LTR56_006700 [Elasticomyces elasticus]|nr:hypothetical protein LTR22_017711 [Elasticomyces elasticus]KAK3649801.1 hypothetical protein LTR56_006700 [Elasticomyces elasticus]KAK5762493.1 hypothetical protein LTS12_007284 [Elasticomyces elasticus]
MARSKRCHDEEAFKPSSKKHQASTSSARPTTRLTTKHSAFNAVLLTTELLEHILNQLPMKDLLLAQRVSPEWRDVICQSPLLQQQLFFLPRREEFVWNLTLPDAETGSAHTLKRLSAISYRQTPEQFPDVIHAGEINEMLAQQVELYNLFRSAEAGDKMPHRENLQLDCKLLTFDCPTASWRKMLLTQPPVQNIGTYFGFDDLHLSEVNLDNPGGVTVGDILKTIGTTTATGLRWDTACGEVMLREFVVMSKEDQGMEVLSEDEWTEKYFSDPSEMYDF